MPFPTTTEWKKILLLYATSCLLSHLGGPVLLHWLLSSLEKNTDDELASSITTGETAKHHPQASRARSHSGKRSVAVAEPTRKCSRAARFQSHSCGSKSSKFPVRATRIASSIALAADHSCGFGTYRYRRWDCGTFIAANHHHRFSTVKPCKLQQSTHAKLRVGTVSKQN